MPSTWSAGEQTLVAPRSDSPEGPVDQCDIHLQGLRETVFLDI